MMAVNAHSKARHRGLRLALLALVCLLLPLAGCKGVPGYVISPSDMASLLADIHTAEAVTEVGGGDYSSDSAKLALKQAVFLAHGTDAAHFDTSLVWYAHHMDKYIEVYDNTIAILEKRSAEAGSMAMREALSMAGDSVDIWAGSRYLGINRLQPSRMLTFDIEQDENWERGDVYVWRFKVIGPDAASVRWGITANYADSTLENFEVTTSQHGWNQVEFYADTTADLARLRGFAIPTVEGQQNVWVDSISLLRRRVSPSMLNTRYRQRKHKDLL